MIQIILHYEWYNLCSKTPFQKINFNLVYVENIKDALKFYRYSRFPNGSFLRKDENAYILICASDKNGTQKFANASAV